MLSLFAVCAPGLEPLLVEELRGLGASKLQKQAGGVAFAGDLGLFYRAHLRAGLPLQLLLRLGAFEAQGFPQLKRRLGELPWSAHLDAGVAVQLRVHSQRSRLHHTGAIAERALEVLRGAVPDLRVAADGERGVGVVLRLRRDRVRVSLDLAGAPLHQRGYRLASTRAPLREDVASALLALLRWQPDECLVDPLCGSGTLPIEAALRAAGGVLRAGRSFAFQDLPGFDSELFFQQKKGEPSEVSAPIIGRDRDRGAVQAAGDNARRAGVFARLRIEQATLSSPLQELPERGVLVANPPWGLRVGKVAALADLHAALGTLARRLGQGWRVGLVTSRPELAQATGLALNSQLMTDQGGVKVRLYTSASGTDDPE